MLDDVGNSETISEEFKAKMNVAIHDGLFHMFILPLMSKG